MRYGELVIPAARRSTIPDHAGRLKIVRAGGTLEAAARMTLLVLEQSPDFLPPCRGLVTAVPQTPLAHISVLARNRGIPTRTWRACSRIRTSSSTRGFGHR